ncbi:MAG: L-aspartate oxidase [Candidatus Eisenbacteria bacterium]|uniref:L-aspartate oxidase n=1 Tax=Eiseniibacteriota bacterium TaxID=2212470 RepID=A0A849SRC4_UNCEI|nr:L-aspartate oxidase [Candidatus Eisenbacteria bacterium]
MKARSTDILILGSGIAGLTLALRAAAHADVLIMTKKGDRDSNTQYAQGGIAAVFERGDSFAAHARDTLTCGAGLCHSDVVRAVVEEAPDRVRELDALGVGFNRTGRGFALGREGGHSRRRIVHATDATGRAIELTLLDRVRQHPRIQLVEGALAVDLILESRLRGRHPGGRDQCWGAYVMDRETLRIHPVTARATVLATGGCGKVYLYTTNPDIATGDGLAMAYRAGVPLANLEFVQFHPTCLYHPLAKSFLLTEALRGEGAVLRTLDGKRFMSRYHRDAELAPRDTVALAIDREMKRRGDSHVLLDITHRPARQIRARFPNIVAALGRFGLDLAREPIPVVPAAHYMCGGVEARLDGRTALAGLFAIGEVACTGLHGANRLASNSLLEALVGAHRGAAEVVRRVRRVPKLPRAAAWSELGTRPALESVVFDHGWDAVRRVMWDLVGIVRTDQRLEFASRTLALLREEIERAYRTLRLTPDLVELRNIALVGELIVRCARGRAESRGLHQNLDHPRPVARLRRDSRVRAKAIVAPRASQRSRSRRKRAT